MVKISYREKGGERGTAYTVGVRYRVSSWKQDYGNPLASFPVPPPPSFLSLVIQKRGRKPGIIYHTSNIEDGEKVERT